MGIALFCPPRSSLYGKGAAPRPEVPLLALLHFPIHPRPPLRSSGQAQKSRLHPCRRHFHSDILRATSSENLFVQHQGVAILLQLFSCSRSTSEMLSARASPLAFHRQFSEWRPGPPFPLCSGQSWPRTSPADHPGVLKRGIFRLPCDTGTMGGVGKHGIPAFALKSDIAATRLRAV